MRATNNGRNHVSSEDKAFMVRFVIVLGALLLFAVLMFLAARLIVSSEDRAAMDDPLLTQAIEERISPVVTMADLNTYNPDAAAAKDRTGEQVYGLACQACHGAGVLGAPKMGDGSAWKARLSGRSFGDLLHSAINGLNAMPARGGNPNLSDIELARAIDYMLGQSGVKSTYQEGSGAAMAKSASAQATPPPAVAEPSTQQAASTQEPAPAAAPASGGPTSATESVDPQRLAMGENRFKMVCSACHTTGVAGAPRVGDKAAWEPRLAKGIDALVNSAIHGKGAMPPKGGAMNYSNDDIRAAIQYMVSTVQ